MRPEFRSAMRTRALASGELDHQRGGRPCGRPDVSLLRFEPGTQRIVGLTVISARWLLDRDGRLTFTIPGTVEASADDLAAALAAA